MNIPRVLIAAPKSGSGKTLITCALLGALKNAGMDVAAVKCGPDYIDPMFHRTVLKIPSENLDTFFTDGEKTRSLLATAAAGHEIVVMEGVMGLFDGLGGNREEGSAYHLAKVTKTPIILNVDVSGMARSMIPMIKGFLDYDKEGLIKAVLLNRISPAFYQSMKPFLEEELRVPVIGIFPNRKDIKLESRHLGLRMPEEIEDINNQLQAAAEQFEETVTAARVIELAKTAEELEIKNEKIFDEKIEGKNGALRLAVARDEAFCFYYAANFRLFKELGVEIVEFSPLNDKELPKDIDGMLFGGGYPELYGEQLSCNEAMKAAVKSAIDKGIPTLAECGGFMYLHEKMTDMEGNTWPLVGAVKGETEYKGRLVRFGYIELTEKEPCFLKEGDFIRAHEFHFYDSTDNGDACRASKVTSDRGWDCVHKEKNRFWGFPHLYYPSNPEFVKNFVISMKEYADKRI